MELKIFALQGGWIYLPAVLTVLAGFGLAFGSGSSRVRRRSLALCLSQHCRRPFC